MTDNDQLLHKIGTLIDKKLEPIKKDMATKQEVADVKQSQAQTNTALEALAAGQKDQATKEDIHRLEQKIDKVDKHVKSHESRIENLEEHTNTPNPHKN